MDNHGKQNVSVGPHTFPLEDIDKKILIETFKLYDSTYAENMTFISESWWKELDNMLRLYGKKGMGFYYGYMMYLNQNKSGEELRNGDINPVVAPGFSVGAQVGSGTHRVGELDGVQMIELEGVFGNATYEGSQDGKTQMEWAIGFDDMGEMKVGPTFIYDYKQYNSEPDEVVYWSIGGSNSENLLAVLLSFYRKYGDSIVDMIESDMLYEEIDTEMKYAIDQQYRNDPETRREIVDSMGDDHMDGYYVGGYKKLSFDVDPKELVNKLAQEKGYGKVVDEMLGGNGTAYFTSKGNVIKLTGDKSEYETANVIKGKNNKYIADVYESGKLNSSHIKGGEGYIVIMEELGLPKQISETFDDCCCGVNKPIYVEYEENPAVIHPPVDGSEECQKLHKNLLMIRQELTQYGIEWSDISVENLGMKNGKLALLDLGETTGGIDTGQSIELNESGADDYWEDDEGRITLPDILELTKDIEIIHYPTILLANLALTWDDNPEEIERISQVEVSTQYPILIMVDEQGELKWILDGNHRAQKALGSKAETIPAKLIKPSNLNDKARRILLRLVNENRIIKEEPGLSPELEIGDVIRVVDIDREVENIQYNRPSPELRPEKFTPYAVVDKESNGSESKHPFRYTLIPEDKLEEYERYEALHNNPLYQKKIGVKLLFPWVHQWIYADTPMANKVDRLTISENMERELNSDLGEDYVQEIVDRVYPHIVNKLGPSKYFDKPPTVELWEDLYARVSGIEGMRGEHSTSSKAQFDERVNVIYVYYPNMEDVEDIIKSLLHEYTHSLQDPDKREDNRKDGYDLDPDEIDSAYAELRWKDYLVYLKDILNEDFEGEQLKLDLPTPIGEWEFPTEWSDVEETNGSLSLRSEDEVQEIKDAVSDEALKYLFNKWDKKGMSFTDLKLLGIPDNNAMTRAFIAKRYLKNTHKKFPVSHTFDCYDLAKMFNTNLRDTDTDYIEDYLCGKDEFWDHKDWYNYEWYDGMSDGLNKDNWETIMKILGVPTQEQAEDLIEGKSNSEEMDRIAEEKEDDIGEIKNFIVWANNDEAEYAMKHAMVEDIKDKLNYHFEGSGKLEEGDYAMTNSPSISYKIEAELFDYLEDDHWGDTELFQYHPDYTGQMLEDILIDFNPVDSNIISGDFSGEIFRAYMMDRYTFEDYDYGAQGDLLEVETKWFDGYYSPNYDINEVVKERLNELEYENLSSAKPITGIETLEEETDIFGQGLMNTIDPEDFEGTDEEWEELLNSKEQLEKKPDYGYANGKTDPSKGFVAPSKEVTDNICTVEGFCEEQGPITFGQLKALVEAATTKRIAADMGRGAFKTLWRLVPFFIPQLLLAAVGVTATRAINKIITPALKDTGGYKSWWGKVVLKAMDIAEGDYIPDVALGDDPLGKVFFVSDGLLQMIRDKYKLKFARYVADYAATRPDNEPVPDWFVENLLRDYLNQKFLLDPPLQQKRGIELEDIKPTGDKTINEDTMARPFSKGESIILKHIYKSFTRLEIQDLTTDTPRGGTLSNRWGALMKMFGIPTNTTESAAASTQYAKYALDNYVEAKNEGGDYSHIKKPEKNRIGWYDVGVDETGAQVEYKSGEVKILAFDTSDAEEKGASEFYDWDGEMEAYEYGDYDSYDTNIRDVEFDGYYNDVPKISEEVSGDSKKHTGEQGDFFTLDGSDNIGNTDIFRDDGFDIIHQHRGNVHLSDISPEESETSIPQGSKKIKKTVLKPRLDKGPFNIPVKMNEHNNSSDNPNTANNPDLNPELVEGDVIELIYMDDPFSVPVKTKGVVMGFEGKPGDFVYKIMVNWITGPDSMSPMALLPEVDIYRFPKEVRDLKEQINFEKPYNDPKAIINGKEIHLDIADTEFLKQKGMMYKTSYPKNRGMLFLWDDIVPISMWMRNTFLPLDIIYMVDGEVVDYDKDVQPCEDQECETYGNVNANQVIELVSGGVDNYNIKVGDKLELIDV